MIFDSAGDMTRYLNMLLDAQVHVGLAQLNKIIANNHAEVVKTNLVEGRDEKVCLREIKEISEGKIALTLESPSWIRSLPSIYHDNAFLQNFIFGLQTMALEHESIINRMEKQFNPSHTEFIDWLSTWVGIRFSQEVDEVAKRRVLNNLVHLYKIRGTKAYFIELIEYIIGTKVRIDDEGSEENLHGSLKQRKGNTRAPFFKVYIEEKLAEDRDEEQKKLHIVKELINAEKPMHVHFTLEYPFAQEDQEMVQTKVMDMHYESAYDYDDLRE